MMKKENNMNQYINDSDFDLNYIQYESNNNEKKINLKIQIIINPMKQIMKKYNI